MFLSICIPTYNRKQKVFCQVKRIIDSGALAQEGIELLVSDNCSEEDVCSYISSNVNIPDNVSLYRQSHNLGLVGNLYFLFEKAKGDYVWFLSDDDPVNPDAILKLIERIKDSQKPMYLLNFRTDIDDNDYWKKTSNYLSLLNDKTWGGWMLLSVQVLKKSSFDGFYKRTMNSYNLCQPLAVSLYGLIYLKGELCFDICAVTHHVGDYSWKKYALQINSIYLYSSIRILRDYNEGFLYSNILEALKKLTPFLIYSFVYLLKFRDLDFLRKLHEDSLLSRIIFKGPYLLLIARIGDVIKCKQN